MTAILIILGVIFYILIGSIVYYVTNRFINDPTANEIVPVVWPIGVPLLICYIIGLGFVYLLEKIFE